MDVNKRFASLSESDVFDLDESKDSLSTKRCVKRSVKLFRSYLGKENINETFEEMPKFVLNNHLRMFFASVRTERGEELKKSTMHSVKYGLSKYIKETCRIDISTDSEFATSKKTFKAKLTDLQKKGKGSVEHKQEIADHDLKKLKDPANLVFNSSTPCGLQNKVWFDIMFHLCRRGRENLRQMTKATFAIEVDSSGREYVRQVLDEADKNHGCDSTPDDTIGEARMYAQPGDSMCPVESFRAYIRKLHPDINDLWQKARDVYESADAFWYCKSPLGKNTLCNIMSQISATASLSKRYTNHCIRATSIAALDRAGFEARKIIRATGHKSELSIKSYSRRLTEGNQRQMSDALCSAFNGTESKQPETSEHIHELSIDDLNSIFSADNDFSEIVLPTPATEIVQPNSTIQSPASVITNYRVDHQTNVAQIIPGSPQIINIPRETNSGYFNIAPNMNNCTVHFHFNGN